MLSTLLSTILVINEVMASNAGEVMSPATNFDSWIELYNPADAAVDLSGMTLSDAEGHTWQMPKDMGSVPAGGFKVVWLGSNNIKSNQATFKLDCDGGTITLTDKSGSVVAEQTYPEALSRTTWARKTDGGDEWGWAATPTPEATNSTSKFATERLAAPVVSIGSKLFTGSMAFEVSIPEGAALMYTTDGSMPQAPRDEAASPWTDYIKNGNCEGTDASCMISRDAGGSGDTERIEDGIGYNGSRGIRVHAIANPQNDYDAQLFVYTPGHIWRSGEKYRFRMKVRADKPAHISAQTHTTPHNYIYHTILQGGYDVTTAWQEIEYEGTITDEQVKKEGTWSWWGYQETVKDMQTIAFNLNENKQENNFYFDDISWELYDDTETDKTQQSTDGKFTVKGTTNYTFRLYQDGYLPSVPVTRSFIQTSNKYTLPIISIVGDKHYFTDPKIGIDCEGDGTNGATGNGQNQPRNYNQDWDRPVNFSYLSPEGEMLFNQDVNLSVSGGYTRTQRFRSFKLKSNKVFDGMNRFDYSFFPQKPYIRSKVLLVRNGGNDIWRHNARFFDPALETIIQRSGIDVDVQSYVPIIEYVNGELRGVLNLREPNNDKFAYANFGYDDEELDAFENLIFKNGDDKVIKRIFELGSHINDTGAYDELKTLLDIDEFTNYMAVTFYLYNDDWPDNNIKGYRSRNDGRYRFVSFDLDYAFKGCWNYSDDNPFTTFAKFKDNSAPRTNYNKDIVNLFLNLLNHDGYRRKFIDTFCVVGGSVFDESKANAIVDELLKNVKAMCQMMRNQGINDGHEPDKAANTIKSNLKGRSEKLTGYLKQFQPMKLSGSTKQSVTLNADTEGAKILVNGINVPYAAFKGHLFAPVRLEAQAPAGYRFAGWKKGNAILSTDAAIDLPNDNSVSLTATFSPLTSDLLPLDDITPVRINEVSAANGIYVNEYFKRNDWVELYNTTSQPIDVEGMYLSDKATNPKKYQITKGNSQASTTIPGHGYLVVWCDKLEPVSQLHASFKLAAEGGDVLLTAADESWTDRLTYGEMKSDETAGRYPDGAANVVRMNVPTIGYGNLTSSYAASIDQSAQTGIDSHLLPLTSHLSIHYAVGRLGIHGPVSATGEEVSVSIANLAGQRVVSLTTPLTMGYAEVALDHLPAGIYIATATDAQGQTVTCKFIIK